MPHLIALFKTIPAPSPDEAEADHRGHVFTEAIAIVGSTDRAMAENPDLFPADLSARIGQGLTRAWAFDCLHTALAGLTERARVHALREKRRVTLDALAVLGKARANAKSPHASADDRLRELRLSYAEALYQGWRRRLKKH